MTKPCWICGNPADSREHKFKKTDVARAGKGWSLDERPYYFGQTGLSIIRGPDSKLVKFDKVLCQACNSTRSQPWDNAYERFSDWVAGSSTELMVLEALDFEEIFGATYKEDVLNLLKYVLKHCGCQLSSRNHTIPADLADLLSRDDLAPFTVSFARNGQWHGVERSGNGPFGNYGMLGFISGSSGLAVPPYVSGQAIGCLDIVYKYGDIPLYPWEGTRVTSSVRSVELGLYEAGSGQPHFDDGLWPTARQFAIGDRRYSAPALSRELRAKVQGMPIPSSGKSFGENLDSCLDVVAALMAVTDPELDRAFLEENLTFPQMNELLRAFHLKPLDE